MSFHRLSKTFKTKRKALDYQNKVRKQHGRTHVTHKGKKYHDYKAHTQISKVKGGWRVYVYGYW